MITETHDSRRAQRIRTREQRAVDVPLTVLAHLLAEAGARGQEVAASVLGPRTVGALTELADAG